MKNIGEKEHVTLVWRRGTIDVVTKRRSSTGSRGEQKQKQEFWKATCEREKRGAFDVLWHQRSSL